MASFQIHSDQENLVANSNVGRLKNNPAKNNAQVTQKRTILGDISSNSSRVNTRSSKQVRIYRPILLQVTAQMPLFLSYDLIFSELQQLARTIFHEFTCPIIIKIIPVKPTCVNCEISDMPRPQAWLLDGAYIQHFLGQTMDKSLKCS